MPPILLSPLETTVVEVGPVAHGGHCVARLDGRVVFVRHTLPGERVRIALTDTTHDSFWRADAVEVVEASPDRVHPRCPAAGPGRCGGCDFQHINLAGQRRLKSDVLAEQLHRLHQVTAGRAVLAHAGSFRSAGTLTGAPVVSAMGLRGEKPAMARYTATMAA